MMLKQKSSASLIVINALAGLSIASAAFAATPRPQPGCPDGWVPATPPLNPQLGCISNTMQPKQAPQLNETIKNPRESGKKVNFPPKIPPVFQYNKCELGIVDPVDCPENNP